MTSADERNQLRGSDQANGHVPSDNRRDFLKKASVLTPSLLSAQGDTATSAATPDDSAKLPQIQIGQHSLSRLICGTNPFNGGSHLTTFVNRAMREYYTPEQIFKTLQKCETAGITCWQAGVRNAELYRQFVDQGLKMHYIAIAAGDSKSIQKLSTAGCVAIAHHGEVTDRYFKTGQIDKVHDYLKRVRDAGLAVGVSTHMPDVVDTIESKGWDLDYYMTCVYERHRSAEALETLLGQAPIPVGEVYLPGDPPRMFKAMNQTKRPCLAFKIMAAGRLSDRREWVERAYKQTFESIKPIDGCIIGIYDRYSDQAAEGAAFVKRFGGTA
jgi:hypothetical protein